MTETATATPTSPLAICNVKYGTPQPPTYIPRQNVYVPPPTEYKEAPAIGSNVHGSVYQDGTNANLVIKVIEFGQITLPEMNKHVAALKMVGRLDHWGYMTQTKTDGNQHSMEWKFFLHMQRMQGAPLQSMDAWNQMSGDIRTTFITQVQQQISQQLVTMSSAPFGLVQPSLSMDNVLVEMDGQNMKAVHITGWDNAQWVGQNPGDWSAPLSAPVTDCMAQNWAQSMQSGQPPATTAPQPVPAAAATPAPAPAAPAAPAPATPAPPPVDQASGFS
jgi:hypothetical protein